MPTKFGPKENIILARFGGGLNTVASEDEINEREAAGGQNFVLDSQSSSLRSRAPFDLVGTTPNAGRINGFITLYKTDGTVSLLVQSGTEVYEWSGSSFSASKATVSSSARLRGRLEHNWQLADEVIVTDLALQEQVKKWDGTTFATVSFTDEVPQAFGTFKAKYCTIDNERAIFSNIHDNGTDFPHMIIGSKSGDYTNISVSQRPSSSLATDDPFFLIQPDYRAINGTVTAFDQIITSSAAGSIQRLTGKDATDFAFSSLYPRSGADGDEALSFVGNDVLYGRQGRIESLVATDKYGDVEQNDISIQINDQIAGYGDWTLAYNSRTQEAYCFSSDGSEAWVLHKPLIGSGLSPWGEFTTQHASGFQPTCVMNVLDPSDGLEYIFFGDSSGNVYRMEGTGTGDAGSTDIRTIFKTRLMTMDLGSNSFNINGWVRYRAAEDTDITIKILHGGLTLGDGSISITLPASASRPVYGGGYYYNDSNYYSQSLGARLRKALIALPSGSSEFQLEVEYNGTQTLDIQEIGLRYEQTA